jgi:DNA-binding NtrC family response regulator
VTLRQVSWVLACETVMSSKHSQRILYVEDDDDIREMMESFLQGEGYAVSSFRTAEDGLEALAREGCDLLLTDYVLPGEDAAWLLREARSRKLLPETPVIVVSAEYKPPGIEGAAFLHKPVKVEILLETIESALSKKRDAAAPRPTAPHPPGEDVELVLYVATPSHESETARRNLGRILRAIGPENFRVTVCDIGRGDPDALRAAEQDRIVVVPTLVKRAPAPTVWIAGDLSKRDRVEQVLLSALPKARRHGG